MFENGQDLTTFISVLLGLLADSILFLIFLKVPLVLNGIGLKFLLISGIMNAANTLAYFLSEAFKVKYNEMCYLTVGALNYTLFSQLNLSIFYTFYIFRVICSKNHQNMLNLKNYLIIDTLVSSSLVAGLLVVVDIDHECK